MKIMLGMCIATMLLAVTTARGDEASERKLLQGAWVPTAGEYGEQPFDDATLKSMKVVIEGDHYTVTVGQEIDCGSAKVDPSAKPKTMDIMGSEGPNKGKTILAIYELAGDTLRICYDLSGGKVRPTEFKTKKGQMTFLVTYKHVKP